MVNTPDVASLPCNPRLLKGLRFVNGACALSIAVREGALWFMTDVRMSWRMRGGSSMSGHDPFTCPKRGTWSRDNGLKWVFLALDV